MLFTLIISNLKMRLRDKNSFFYALIFPVIFLTIFGLFDMDHAGDVNAVIVEKDRTSLTEGVTKALKDIEHFKITESKDENEFSEELGDDKKDIILELKDISNPLPKVEVRATYKKDNGQSASIAMNTLNMVSSKMSMELAKTPEIMAMEENVLNDKKFKYYDFLFPGILGMSLMMYSIMNAGIYLTRSKEQFILKRLFVTPLKGRQFFLAETLTYLLIASIQITLILLYSKFIFGANIYGSIPLAFAVTLFGTLIFINIGFMVSMVSKTSTSAEGLANIIAMPMMFLSGTFFQRELLPKIVQDVSYYFPLTPLLDALRSIIISGNGIGDIQKELSILFVWFIGSYLILAKFFKFSEE